MRGAALLAGLALAACQPAAPPESHPPAEEVLVKVGPITSAEELEGIYRVADLEGIDMDGLGHGFSVIITRSEIDTLERCIYLHWRYRFEGERLVTDAIERSPCRRALNPDEAALMDALDGAEKATRTPSNGILLEGPGGSVTLFTQ